MGTVPLSQLVSKGISLFLTGELVCDAREWPYGGDMGTVLVSQLVNG